MSKLLSMMMSGGGDIPAQYTVVDWIQPSVGYYNNVTCYIETNVTATEDTVSYFKMDFILYSSLTTNTSYIGNLFGSEGDNGGYSFNILTYTGNTGSGNGGEANLFGGYAAHLQTNTKMSIELKNGVYSTSLGHSQNITFNANKQQKGTMAIFCVRGTYYSYQANMKLYGFKLGKSENELVRDYVPVYDTVSQKYGLYDKVTQTFSTNTYNTNYPVLGGND